MNIKDFAEYMQDPIWSEITSVKWRRNELYLTFLVPDIDPQEEYIVHCKNVLRFQIRDTNTEWVIFGNDCIESLMYGGSTKTYVIWGESVDWAHIIGRLAQEFGELPEFLNPYWIKETKKFNNYRLPLTIPESIEDKFISLIKELKLNYFLQNQKATNQVSSTLRINDSSFVVAEEFNVKQTILS